MFWKKKKTDSPESSNPASQEQKGGVILGMILLKDEQSFSGTAFISDYQQRYGNSIQLAAGDNASAIFTIHGETVAIAHIPAPVPAGDIVNTAQYAYNWRTAEHDTKYHQGHLIVSVMQSRGSQATVIDRFKIFTQVICSLLSTTNAVGVYKGSPSLLFPKDQYLQEAQLLNDNKLPVNLWIYIGLRQTATTNAGYTQGMSAFGKTEMEVVNSPHTIGEIRNFLFSMANYVLSNNITFRNGETVGASATEKIAITLSEGQLVAGDTLKFSY